MSVVNILNIQVLDNPTRFTNPFQFEITFECTLPLQDDLEWKIIYVGSAEDEQYDQTLDCIMVGPVPVGINKFVYQADAPNTSLIPTGDVTGVTVVLLTCSYRGQEFVRVGYYVNNEYDDEQLRVEPPTTLQIEQLTRNILADKPRVTRFPIKWDALDELEPPVVPAGMEMDDEDNDDEQEKIINDSDDDNKNGNNNTDTHEHNDNNDYEIAMRSNLEHRMITDNFIANPSTTTVGNSNNNNNSNSSLNKKSDNPFNVPFSTPLSSNATNNNNNGNADHHHVMSL